MSGVSAFLQRYFGSSTKGSNTDDKKQPMTSNKALEQPSSVAAKEQARPICGVVESTRHYQKAGQMPPKAKWPATPDTNGHEHKQRSKGAVRYANPQPYLSRRTAREFAEVRKKCKQIADNAQHSRDLLGGDRSYELGIFGLMRPHYFNEEPKMSPEMIEICQREHRIFWTIVCAELTATAKRR